ncbi:hypothetical protein D3871_19570 [Noviherbaspirillum saxi]|uniref:Uncharacterized protein n=1 Tax=Noviherbaspirillum saxi TaxID=2320863 RepID=A0A3A3FQ58_9BURK|nr:hypothetical protein D3871_19570 [Noviherbaspirillum saxi]
MVDRTFETEQMDSLGNKIPVCHWSSSVPVYKMVIETGIALWAINVKISDGTPVGIFFQKWQQDICYQFILFTQIWLGNQ